VSTDPADLTEHGRDWWPVTVGWTVREGAVPTRPAAVARPSSRDEVAAVLALCSSAGVPVTPMAGRSGVCGGALPVHGGVALDLNGLSGIVAVENDSLTVDVRAGTYGDVLEDELRAAHGLTLGHWPQSIALSTVGGWVACRSAGQYSTRYGKIEDMVTGLEVVLADGRVLRTGGRAPREAVGPDLTQLFVGSEGVLGVVTEARLRVHPVPDGEGRAAYGFPSFDAGLDTCRRILRRGATPAVLRLYDAQESARSFGTAPAGTPGATNVLLVLDEAEPGLAAATMAVVEQESAAAGAEVLEPALVSRWLSHRNDVAALAAAVSAGLVVDTIEVAASWSALPAVHADVTAAVLAVPGAVA
jgi:alkyldihydroxyacetonephosphate synthase